VPDGAENESILLQHIGDCVQKLSGVPREMLPATKLTFGELGGRILCLLEDSRDA
jgi:hypothetical protein